MKKEETKSLSIDIPEGYEIDESKSTFKNIVFKKIEVKTKLPKSWGELKYIRGFYISSSSSIEKVNKAYLLGENRNIFPTKELAEATLALAQLSQLRDAYNATFIGESSKFYKIYRIGNTIYIASCVTNTSPLSFYTKELADEFLKNFKDLIEIAKPLL